MLQRLIVQTMVLLVLILLLSITPTSSDGQFYSDGNKSISKNESMTLMPQLGTSGDYHAEMTNYTVVRNSDPHHENKKLFLTLSYACVLAIGLPGNIVFIISIIRLNASHIARNLFLVNLAFGDLVNIAICIPIGITGLYVSWPFGSFVCRWVLPMTDVVIGNTIFTLLALSFERYRVIIQPMKERLKIRRVVQISICLWVISYLTIGVPLVVSTDITDGYWVEKTCTVKWLHRHHEVTYRIGVFFALFCMPFTAVTFCFVRMRKKLKANSDFASGSMDTSNEIKRSIQNKRIVTLLGVIVICFTVCYVPINILMIVRCFYKAINRWKHTALLFQISFVLLLCHSVVNPIAMFLLTKKIRHMMKRYLMLIFCCDASRIPVVQVSRISASSSGQGSAKNLLQKQNTLVSDAQEEQSSELLNPLQLLVEETPSLHTSNMEQCKNEDEQLLEESII